ncbi:hypothetical protein CTAYLR_010756 [Chrysophaeum taylorii]|uniref:Tubby C-terminal domain-containing protein n=1 Tax=Chrysophaeum taylorii TaxID=2483200 RepID=A0AAD7U8F9_9STRA|nr:hypothetical protein CTAYLR_010756 [Chrysophaeum taylorii]
MPPPPPPPPSEAAPKASAAALWRLRQAEQGTVPTYERHRPEERRRRCYQQEEEIDRHMESALARTMMHQEEEGSRRRREDRQRETRQEVEEEASVEVPREGPEKRDPFKPTRFDVRSIPFVLRKLHKFVLSPAPAGGGVVVRCFIERDKSNFLFPSYKLYADHEDGTGRFIMAARKVPGGTPHYVFSTSTADLFKARARRGRNYLGKLRGNGANYVLFDKGDKPPGGELDARRRELEARRRELCAISFSPRCGRRSSNPRHVEVALPQVRWRPRRPDDPPPEDPDLDDGGISTVEAIHPLRDQDGLEHILTLIQGQGGQNVLYADRALVIHVRETKYDPLSSCLVDFKARASIASTKNFQLIKSPPLEEHMKRAYYKPGGEGANLDPSRDANHQPVLLQMGKVGKHCFNMDYQFPLSMFQAFAICVARFDTKVQC